MTKISLSAAARAEAFTDVDDGSYVGFTDRHGKLLRLFRISAQGSAITQEIRASSVNEKGYIELGRFDRELKEEEIPVTLSRLPRASSPI